MAEAGEAEYNIFAVTSDDPRSDDFATLEDLPQPA
jgi:hypothetical protein